jgi:hypothetical protein
LPSFPLPPGLDHAAKTAPSLENHLTALSASAAMIRRRAGPVWPQGNAIFLFSANLLRQSRLIDSLAVVDSSPREGHLPRRPDMLDGNRYFAEFPDEDPARPQALLHSRTLLATLRALEKELRPYIPKPVETSVDADESQA